MRTVTEDFQRLGPAYERANEILVHGCQIPVSVEVFAQELKTRREQRPDLTPEDCARRLVDGYHRTRGLDYK